MPQTVILSNRRAPGVQLAIELEQSGALTVTSLDLSEEMGFDRYESLGRFFGLLSRSLRWWIGDWINYGEGTFGERFAQAMAATGLEEPTLLQYAYVCRQVPKSRRRESLSFGCHHLVAPMDPKAQEYWLAQADENSMTTKMLRSAIADASEATSPRLPGTETDDTPEIEKIAFAIIRDMIEDPDHPGYVRIPIETIERLRAALDIEA